MRTFISKRLYEVDYDFARYFLATTIFVIIAFINTFIGSMILQVGSSVVGLIIIVMIYKREIKHIFNIGKTEIENIVSKCPI